MLWSYTMPASANIRIVSLLVAHAGAVYPRGFSPVKAVNTSILRSKTACSCSTLICEGKFARVAVQGDFVACIADLGELIWEGLEGVTWYEECGGNVVAFGEGEEPFAAGRCAEDAAGYVGWICRRTVGCV